MKKILDTKRHRKIFIVLWGGLICLNLVICSLIPTPSIINWVVLGIAIGVFFTDIMNYFLINSAEEVINSQNNLIEKLFRIADAYNSKKEKKK